MQDQKLQAITNGVQAFHRELREEPSSESSAVELDDLEKEVENLVYSSKRQQRHNQAKQTEYYRVDVEENICVEIEAPAEVTPRRMGESPIPENILYNFTEENQAAIKIQAIQRGRIHRNYVENERMSLSEQHLAAARIQAHHKGRLERKEIENRRQAAIKVQSNYRGFKQRQRYKARVQGKHGAAKLQSIIGENAARASSSKNMTITESLSHATSSHTTFGTSRRFRDAPKEILCAKSQHEPGVNKPLNKKVPSEYKRPWRMKHPKAPTGAGGKRSETRRDKSFARKFENGRTLPNKPKHHMEGGSSIETAAVEGNGPEVARWPKKAISGWEQMVSNNYGIQWPNWGSALPKSVISATRRRKIREYKNKMDKNRLEKMWDNRCKFNTIVDAQQGSLWAGKKRGKHKKERKTDHQIKQQHILRKVKQVYKEAAGYYNAAISVRPSMDKSQARDNTGGFMRMEYERKQLPHTSPLYRAGIVSSFSEVDEGHEALVDGSIHGMNEVEIGQDGHYFVDTDFPAPYDHIEKGMADAKVGEYQFDDIYTMNKVLEDPESLCKNFVQLSDNIKQSWVDLDVPIPEREYIANHFFSDQTIANYIQMTTHSILLSTLKAKSNSIIDVINERKVVLTNIVKVMTQIQKGGNVLSSPEDMKRSIEKVYILTRKVIKMIEEWKKIAPWTKVFYVDGDNYIEVIELEMAALEKL